MNNKEVKTLLEVYGSHYEYYKLSDFESEREKSTIKGMQILLKSIGVDYVNKQNEIYFNSKVKHDDWIEFCTNGNSKEIEFNQYNFDWLIEEVRYTTKSDSVYKARREVMMGFYESMAKTGKKINL